MLIGVTERDCGGAERFFSDFFSRYATDAKAGHKLYFFVDHATRDNMQALGKLRTDKNVIVMHNRSNRFKNILEPLEFLYLLLRHRISLVQVTSYTEAFFPRIQWIRFLPAALRPKTAVTIVDCEIPYALEDPQHQKHQVYQVKYGGLFGTLRIDAVLSWYQKFIEFASHTAPYSAVPYMEAIKTRYADLEDKTVLSAEKKEKLLIWAARITSQKAPLMLPEAIRILVAEGFDFAGWRFEMYGHGEMLGELKDFIKQHRLGSMVFLMGNQNMEPVFAKSTCFISTQDYENFPSMSMMEAMRLGNVIISRQVGQTSLMVKDGINGFLLKEDSAHGLAAAIRQFIQSPGQHPVMAGESVRLTTEVHTYENFRKQAEEFWEKATKVS